MLSVVGNQINFVSLPQLHFPRILPFPEVRGNFYFFPLRYKIFIILTIKLLRFNNLIRYFPYSKMTTIGCLRYVCIDFLFHSCTTSLYPIPRTLTIRIRSSFDNLCRSFVMKTCRLRELKKLSSPHSSSKIL